MIRHPHPDTNHALMNWVFRGVFGLDALVIAALCASCAGCGGGSDQPTQAAAAHKYSQLVAIGNSLTIHAPDASLGWSGNWGMAASDQAHDYAHIVATGLGVPVLPTYNRILEQTGDVTLIPPVVAPIDSRSAVVVELGDNAAHGVDPAFAVAYSALLDAVVARHPARLVCTSSWGADNARDEMQQQACTAHGGTFVYIGDILPTRKDVIPAGENPGVASHPHDPSMAVIAQRVLAAVGSAS